MDFSRTLRGITIEGRSPLPMPRYRVAPLKTFRHCAIGPACTGTLANLFTASRAFLGGPDGAQEGGRSLPLLREDWRRGDPADGQHAGDRRYRANPGTDDEPRADGRHVADRARGRVASGNRAGGRYEGPRARAREGLRVQARLTEDGDRGGTGSGRTRQSGPLEGEGGQEEARQEELGEEGGG